MMRGAVRESTGNHVTCGSGTSSCRGCGSAARASSSRPAASCWPAAGFRGRLPSHHKTLDRLLHSEGKVERERAMNRNRWRNVLEQRGVVADGCGIASGQYVEPNVFGRKIARQTRRSHHAGATHRRKNITDQQDIQAVPSMGLRKTMVGSRDGFSPTDDRIDWRSTSAMRLPSGTGCHDAEPLPRSSDRGWRDPDREAGRDSFRLHHACTA